MTKRESKVLRTKDDVIAALGGARVVGELTGAGYKNAENWKREKIFPSRYYLVMTHALAAKGFSAPPELWGQVTPAERKAAIAAAAATQRQRMAS